MRDVNRKYYLNRFLEHGEDVRSFWGSRESQEMRFSVLCRIGDLTNTTVLDVGCGLGDFYDYLKNRKIQIKDYVGLDCVEETLVAARKRYPAARFDGRDILQIESRDEFDWVFGSGLFTLKDSSWNDYVLQMVRRMYTLARRGVGVNFLSSFTNRPDGISHYSHPSDVLRILTDEVCPIVELIHSYRPNDFTVFLYKDLQEPRNS